MTKNVIFAVLATALSLFSTNAKAEADPNFYIYLCIGQSNMEGQGTIEDCDLSPDERFQMMSTLDCGTRKQGQWYRAIPPLAVATPVSVRPTTSDAPWWPTSTKAIAWVW